MARRLALPLAVLLASNIYAMPLLGRAPHFAEIMFPAADYLLLVNSSAQDNATVMFQYRNGERADETTCTVSLANATGAWLLAQNVSFYNSYYVNATLVVPLANLTDGNYTLIAMEIFDGSITSQVQQPFGISHNPDAFAPTGSQEVVNPYATTTTSSSYASKPTLASATGTSGPSSNGNGTIGDSMSSILNAISAGGI